MINYVLFEGYYWDKIIWDKLKIFVLYVGKLVLVFNFLCMIFELLDVFLFFVRFFGVIVFWLVYKFLLVILYYLLLLYIFIFGCISG